MSVRSELDTCRASEATIEISLSSSLNSVRLFKGKVRSALSALRKLCDKSRRFKLLRCASDPVTEIIIKLIDFTKKGLVNDILLVYKKRMQTLARLMTILKFIAIEFTFGDSYYSVVSKIQVYQRAYCLESVIFYNLQYVISEIQMLNVLCFEISTPSCSLKLQI